MTVEKSLEWVEYIQKRKTGGLPAWSEGEMDRTFYFRHYKDYPEVTGYMIPTLIDYGKLSLAERLGRWLLTQQNEDGLFNNLEGEPETFDTGMACLGLHAINLRVSAREGFWNAYKECVAYLRNQMVEGDRIKISPRNPETNIYLLKVCGVIGDYRPVAKLLPIEHPKMWEGERLHYVAYGLEGLDYLGYTDQVEYMLDILVNMLQDSRVGGLVPWAFQGNGPQGTDTCATAQLAILMMRYDKDSNLINGMVNGVRLMRHEKGGIYHSTGDKRCTTWSLKYYLDMEKEFERWN